MESNRRQSAFLMADLIVALSVLGVLIVALALSLDKCKRFNHYQWTRQQCLAAGQAQLDGFAQVGRPIDPNTTEALWPGVATHVVTQAGTGDWEGMRLITVRAEAASFHRRVRVELARYITEKP